MHLQEALSGRYTIEAEVGQGGTAIVYRALDLKLNRPVALKVLRPEIALTVARERFLREIQIAAGLSHPHILPLHDSGVAASFLYYVMPFVEGESLRDRLRREPKLPTEDALALAVEVADALAYAHARGFVHRDIKPENILLSAGHALVADFGIARALTVASDSALTATGSVMGTAAYMAPEQGRGDPVGSPADVYSLGCVLFEMLAGRAPFIGPTPAALLAQHATDPPPSLRAERPDVPKFIEHAVDVSLAKAPSDRFATGAEFGAVLRGQASPHPRRRFPRRLALRGGAIAIMGATALWIWSSQDVEASRFSERDWILVADFEGPGPDRAIADAVRELTTAELNQSRFLSTLPRQALNAAMRSAGIPETTRVGPDLARELATRSAVRAVLVGSVKSLGRGYSIVMHVVSAEDGSDIVSVAGAATDTSLIPSVQRLARSVRRGLGEQQDAIEATLPLDQVATPSFVAFQRYVDGVRLQDRGDGPGSRRLLREALALDSGFASAWFVLGWSFINDRMLDSARRAFTEALRRPERLGVPRRFRAEADFAYTVEYDIPAAIAAYDLYLEHFPRSPGVRNNRGSFLIALDRYEEALAEFERAARDHPWGVATAQIYLANEAATLIALGRGREASRAAERLTGPFGRYIAIMHGLADDRWRDVDSLARDALGGVNPPEWLRVQATAALASAQAAQGDVRQADSILAAASRTGSPDVQRWFRRARLLLGLAAGRSIPTESPTKARPRMPADYVTDGLIAAAMGDTAVARHDLRALDAVPPAQMAFLGKGPALATAWIEARTGRWADAARLIGRPASLGEHDTALLDRVGSLSLRWLAAEAQEHLGHADSAAALWQLVLRPRRMPGNEFALRGLVSSFAHRRLAMLYDRAGQSGEAARHWRIFSEHVTRPDSVLRHSMGEGSPVPIGTKGERT